MTTKTEHRVIATADEVRAFLAGKTQWRVPMEPQPPEGTREIAFSDCREFCRDFPGETQDWKLPWQPGDRIVVLESFSVIDDPAAHHLDDGPYEPIAVEGVTYEPSIAFAIGPEGERWVVDYEADNPNRIMDKIGKREWTSPELMLDELSRITVEVVDVRPELLQGISEQDAASEGVNGGCLDCGCEQPCRCVSQRTSYRDSFIWHWNARYAERGLGWDVPQWVWNRVLKLA